MRVYIYIYFFLYVSVYFPHSLTLTLIPVSQHSTMQWELSGKCGSVRPNAVECEYVYIYLYIYELHMCVCMALCLSYVTHRNTLPPSSLYRPSHPCRHWPHTVRDEPAGHPETKHTGGACTYTPTHTHTHIYILYIYIYIYIYIIVLI